MSRNIATTTPTGFAGLGHMGGAMARRLLDAGLPVLAYDLDPLAMERVAAAGAAVARSAGDLARRCEVVLLCLPSPQASDAVVDELLRGDALRVVVETSTVGPASVRHSAQRLAAAGVQVVDAPVSGGPRGAQAGTLSLMYAGADAAVELAGPQLRAIAGRLFRIGAEPGLAQVCKLVNNAISAAGMMAACEATVVGVKAGLEPGLLLQAINAGSGRNAATLDKFPAAILNGRFDYGGPLGLMLKDLSLFIEEAQAAGVPSLLAPAALAAWQEAVRRSGPEADYSMAIRHLEIDAGVEVRARSMTKD